MDTPLLALTRQSAGHQPGTVATENMRQLIQLRWIAVIGQLLTILTVGWGLGVPLPMVPMLATVALLAAANLAGTLTLYRHRIRNAEVLLALLLDMGALTFQLYLSGGATNPFISLYLLQVVLGAILLEAWSAWVLVVATSLCYALLSVSYRPLVVPPGLLTETADLYRLGDWLGFVMAGVLLVLFIARISRTLRAREAYLADLRRRAAEEDAIVRMGLFASGAAHELGTPLASLSVILADWRRMPKVTADPELSQEVAEMQAEVQRCKAIVTDILHSAGEPRSEAMESRAARPFLDEVVDGWQSTHPAVPLDYRSEDVERAMLVADPALRQAIWNLLDNAAETSPDYVALTAGRQSSALVLTVTDNGPGFTPGQLDAIGKPYHSSKGAGHGLGLFLAGNVARRLGGRLEAGNLDDGGAEVRLVLPIVGDLT
ncbi:MAG: HAMP domain-containing histidine kinase [Proteobacteria bacterium]|nr:HAMP domain-containing histidine kinase [Pseudomonadota bacterium]